MKKLLPVACPLAVLAALVLMASPAQAVGPYCSDYCNPWISCSSTCYIGGSRTTCSAWDGSPCGVCVPSTYWWGTTGPDTHTGTPNNDWMNSLEGDDSLYGSSGNDVMWGYSGNDSLYGEGGNDCLYGDSGSDYANGGSGHDICVAESETSCDD